MNSDTPRTNALQDELTFCEIHDVWVRMSEHARQLERELSEAKEKLRRISAMIDAAKAFDGQAINVVELLADRDKWKAMAQKAVKLARLVVDKVESGRMRSVHTYAEAQDILSRFNELGK